MRSTRRRRKRQLIRSPLCRRPAQVLCSDSFGCSHDRRHEKRTLPICEQRVGAMSKKKTEMSAGDGPLLTVKQVADLDHCSEKTVRRAIAAGHLEATRIGPAKRLVRITSAAHARYRAGY